MTEPKFTPGPWHVENRDKPYVMEKNGIALAQIWDCSVISREQADANAHLIAAAPEMYEMLASIRETLKYMGYLPYLVNDIDLILRKARGESEVEK